MRNEVVLVLSQETEGVLVGTLFHRANFLFSTTHPTTAAAAIFAIGEPKLILSTKLEIVRVSFPIAPADMCVLLGKIDNVHEADFIIGLADGSWFDFLDPHPADTDAEFHLTEAVSHLPARLVRNGPSSSESKGGTKKLRTDYRRSPFAAKYPESTDAVGRAAAGAATPECGHAHCETDFGVLGGEGAVDKVGKKT
jgi:hypothetical protein